MLNACGGDVIKFAGDALIVLWQPEFEYDNETNLDLKSMACRAAECALLLQEELHGAELAKDVTFSVKIGISCENATIMHLGGMCNRVEYTACGKALLDAFECESYCQRGDTVVSGKAWQLLRDNFFGVSVETPIPKAVELPKHKSEKATKQTTTRRASVDQGSSSGKRRSLSLAQLEYKKSHPRSQEGSTEYYDFRRASSAEGSVRNIACRTSSTTSSSLYSSTFVKLVRNKKRMKKKSLRKTFLSNADEIKALNLYIPGAVKSFVDGFQSSWASDLRTTTVCFVNLKLEVLKFLSQKRKSVSSIVLKPGKRNKIEKAIFRVLVNRYSSRILEQSTYAVAHNAMEVRSVSFYFEIKEGAKKAKSTDNTLQNVLNQVQDTFLLVQKLVYALEGSVDKFLIDDKGSTLLTVWGLPPLTHFDDSLRGCLFGLRLVDNLAKLKLVNKLLEALRMYGLQRMVNPGKEFVDEFAIMIGNNSIDKSWLSRFGFAYSMSGLSNALDLLETPEVGKLLDMLDFSVFKSTVCNVGITTGEILSGPVGSGCRKDYSVLGDVVNTSARLMQASAKQALKRSQQFYGCILCNGEVKRSCGSLDTPLVFDTLQPIKLKGKLKLVEIYQPAYSGNYMFDKLNSLSEKENVALCKSLKDFVDTSSTKKATDILECYGQRLDLRIFNLFSECLYSFTQGNSYDKNNNGCQCVILIGNVNSGKSLFLRSFIYYLEKKCLGVTLGFDWRDKSPEIKLASEDIGVRVWVIHSSASVEMFPQLNQGFMWKKVLSKLLYILRRRQGKKAVEALGEIPVKIFDQTYKLWDSGFNGEMYEEAINACEYIFKLLSLIVRNRQDFVVITLDTCHYCSRVDWLLSSLLCNTLKPHTECQRRVEGLFITIATRPLHRISAKHAFSGIDPSYVKIVHMIHVSAYDINYLTKVEIAHFVKVYSDCEFVHPNLTDFLHRITGGNIGLLKSVFDELSETQQIVEKKGVCRMNRNVKRSHNKPISIPPKTKRIYSKVFDQLSNSTRLLLKCASVLCYGFDQLDIVEIYFLYMIFPQPGLLEDTETEKSGERFVKLESMLEELVAHDLIRLEKHYWTPEEKTATESFSLNDFAIFKEGSLKFDDILKHKLVFKNCFIRYLAYGHLLEVQRKKLHKNFLDRVRQLDLTPTLLPFRMRELKIILLYHALAAKDDISSTQIEAEISRAGNRKMSVFNLGSAFRTSSAGLAIQKQCHKFNHKTSSLWTEVKGSVVGRVRGRGSLDSVMLDAIDVLRDQNSPDRLESFLIQRASVILEDSQTSRSKTPRRFFCCFRRASKISPKGDNSKYDSNEGMLVLKGKRTNNVKSAMDVSSGFKKRPTYLRMLSEGALKIIIKNLIESVDSWSFDVFEFERCSHGQPLFMLSRVLFEKLGLTQSLGISEQAMINFMVEAEHGYPDNPYHNSLHAADVLLTVNVILFKLCAHQDFLPILPWKDEIDEEDCSELITKFDIFNSFIASMIHDYLHPGVTSQYLVDTQDSIYLSHIDPHLENFHFHEAMMMIQDRNKRSNIFGKMDPHYANISKKTICGLVLSTALSKHNSFLDNFKQTVENGMSLTSYPQRLMVLELAIKCADVSNPAKNLELYRNWVVRITEEFYAQGDLEALSKRPVSKFMDRTVEEVQTCQIGFTNFIVKPLFQLLELYKKGMKELYESNFAENLAFWKLECWTATELVNVEPATYLCRNPDYKPTKKASMRFKRSVSALIRRQHLSRHLRKGVSKRRV